MTDVVAVEIASNPWRELSGMRYGTGIPRVIALGTMLRAGANDVVALYGGAKPAVVVTLRAGAKYQRLMATVDNPQATVSSIREHLTSAV